MSQTTHLQHKVNRPRRRQGLWILAVVVAAVTAAGCSSSPSPSPTVTETVTATPTATPTAPPTAPAGDSIAGIPFYKPSTVSSHTGDSAVLTSPHSVTQVTDFYLKLVNTGGWTTVSKSVTPHNGNLVIKKSGQGATIDISPSGSGSVITISTYPTG